MRLPIISNHWVTLIFLVLITACGDKNEVPTCIQEQVDDREEQNSIHLSRVVKYDFQGSEVYLFEYKGGNDLQHPVLGDECTTLCALGGIAGNKDCNGDPFHEEAEEIEVVWEE